MTDLQIELEWESYKLANPHLFKKDEVYRDPDYDEVEREVTETASAPSASEPEYTDSDREDALARLAELQRKVREGIEGGGVPGPAPTNTPTHEEWEDVPLDGGETS